MLQIVSQRLIEWGFESICLQRCVLGLIVLACWPYQGFADEDDVASQAVRLLHQRCVACHGAEKQEGSLRLDTQDAMLLGGDRGDTLNVESPGQSLLLLTIRQTHPEVKMPPKHPLLAEEVALMERWIFMGTPWPDLSPLPEGMSESAEIASDVSNDVGNAFEDERNPIRTLFGGKRLDLWSLRPIRRPDLPPLPDTWPNAWCLNQIDRFLASDWSRQGFRPTEDIDWRGFMRRSAFDLTGLPPELGAVEDAHSQDADHETWVDRLLASPTYGEHLGRMWLDVVRYSDSNGFDWDEFRPQAWRYRNYVIRAWNRDLPFDRFVREQLAGDELLSGAPRSEDEQDTLVATGYLRMGPHDNAASLFNEQDRSRAELLADLTETTGSAFLGMTLSCCRCHDHKTEPLSQVDHYRLRAFFAAINFADELPIDLDREQTVIRDHNSQVDIRIDELRQQQRAIKEAIVGGEFALGRNSSKSKKGDRAENNESTWMEKMSAQQRSQYEVLESEIQAAESNKRKFTFGFLMTDKRGDIPATFVFYQGDHRQPRQSVEPGFPSVLFPVRPTFNDSEERTTSGRRLTLAEWIVRSDNPWTARVIVNRLWQATFGVGLVETANDFGYSGSTPNHPQLLDWLAAELIDSGWSLKHIHRLMVTSRAYRQRATNRNSHARNEISPRRGLRRLSAEQLRDSMLSVSGLLQHRESGPPVWPELDPEVLQANPAFLDDNETRTKGWYPSASSDQTVRSVYLIQKRTVRVPWMETFDLPENSVSCPNRDVSIVPPQALALLNGLWAKEAAIELARQIRNQNSSKQWTNRDAIRDAFRRVLQRKESQEELNDCLNFLQRRTFEELCLALLNSNEFIFIE